MSLNQFIENQFASVIAKSIVLAIYNMDFLKWDFICFLRQAEILQLESGKTQGLVFLLPF